MICIAMLYGTSTTSLLRWRIRVQYFKLVASLTLPSRVGSVVAVDFIIAHTKQIRSTPQETWNPLVGSIDHKFKWSRARVLGLRIAVIVNEELVTRLANARFYSGLHPFHPYPQHAMQHRGKGNLGSSFAVRHSRWQMTLKGRSFLQDFLATRKMCIRGGGI